MVRLAGLEPATLGLEGRCSIQMSYKRVVWSGKRDSNPRHPAPKAGALPDCAIPRLTFLSDSFNEIPERDCYDIGIYNFCQSFFNNQSFVYLTVSDTLLKTILYPLSCFSIHCQCLPVGF